VEHLTVYQAKGLTATTNEQQYITDMLQRDYFLRILQEFATALALFLEKKKDNKDDDLEDLYRQYVGTYEVVRNLAFEELLQYAEDQWIADERMSRLEMTAELLYAESHLQGRTFAHDAARQSLSGLRLRGCPWRHLLCRPPQEDGRHPSSHRIVFKKIRS
jgi:hypothetical protein